MSKILLVGNYGVGNIGDDLLREGALAQLSDLGCKKVFICGPGKDCDTPLPPAGIRSFFSMNYFRFWRSLQKSDYVIFGGGGLLNPEEPRSLFIWGQVIVWAFLFGKPVYMIGQSFSFVNSVIKFILGKVERISVRDSFSYDLLKESGYENVVLGQDLAWNVEFDTVRNVEAGVVGLNVRKFKYVPDEKMIEVLSGLFRRLEGKGFSKVKFLNFDEKDGEYFRSLKIKTSIEVEYIEGKKSALFEAISNCELVVTERLHAGISTVKLERPILPLSYSSKVKSVFEDLGCDWLVDLRGNAMNIDLDKIEVIKKPQLEKDEVLSELLS